MKLVKFSNKREDWVLDEISFQDVNLLVGKNATGKSRVIEALNALVRVVILQSFSRIIVDANWYIELDCDGISLSYFVKLKNNIVLEEKIVYNGEKVLIRENGITKIKSIEKNTFEEINPPEDKIVLHVRRDTKDYPFLETLVQWAESSYGIEFSRIIPNLNNDKENRFGLLSSTESIPKMFNILSDVQKKNIITSFNNLGYKLEQINVIEDNYGIYLTIKEKGISKNIEEYFLSQGMLRSFYLLIFTEYLASKKTPQLIVIDDLAEGLDYDRATKLANILFDLCLSKNIQLIATSNDSFLMDVIDIKYWNVLYREDSVVKSRNIISHPELFENFKFTGLSNFDFFSSDYIEQKLKEK